MTIKFGLYHNPPLSFVDSEGKPTGIFIDLIEHIAKQEGFKIQYVKNDWSILYKMLADGQIDALAPFAYSEARKNLFRFNNETVITNWGQLYISPNKKLQSLVELEGKRIGVNAKDIYYENSDGLKTVLKKLGVQCTFIESTNYNDLLDMLETGHVDAVLMGRLFGHRYEGIRKIIKSPIIISPIEVRYAFNKQNNKLKDIIISVDKNLREMKNNKDSIYNLSISKWLSSDAKNIGISKIFIYALIIAIAIIFLAIINNFYLKRKIKSTTGEILNKNKMLQKEITERISAEENSRENEERYKKLFKYNQDPIFIIDFNGKIVESNDEAQTKFTLESPDSVSGFFTYNGDKQLDDLIINVTKNGFHSFEAELIGSDNEIFYSELTANSFEYSGNKLIQLITKDITARKKAEEMLKREKEKLESQLLDEAEQRRINERMMMEQAKLASMGQMINAIAHQWRQPLTTIGLLVQDIEDANLHEELDDEYIIDFKYRALNQINFMSKTIDDFRDFFKPDKKKTNFNLCTIMMDIFSLTGSQMQNNDIDINITCNGQFLGKATEIEEMVQDYCVLMHGYPNEFKQVMLNLFHNAKDAIMEKREKEGFLHGDIHMTIVFDTSDINISIEDNGGGIQEDVLNRIFEPYFSTKDEGKGVGIGLYMSKMIIENNMDGLLTAVNGEKGAKFNICLKAGTIAD